MTESTDTGALLRRLDEIADEAAELEARFADELEQIHPNFRASARNLIDYVAMRRSDMRDLQEQLAYLGLASLGSAEKDVMASIRSVRNALGKIANDEDYDPESQRVDFEHSERRLQMHIDDILGKRADGRDVRIMVTLPAEAADEYALIRDLLVSGMDIARINCAHDDERVWLRIIENIRKSEKETGRACRIVIDLAGPKLRTGALRRGPGVVRIRPKRDSTGRVIAPRRVRFIPEGTLWSHKARAAVPVPQDCIDDAEIGDRFRFRDTRGKRRKLKVVGKDDKGLRLDCYKKALIAAGTKLWLIHPESGDTSTYRVGKLPPSEDPIILRRGDPLVLHREATPGEPAVFGGDGSVVEPAHIACTLPEVLGYVSGGDPIHLNDGKIEGVVTSATDEELVIEITRAKATGSRLRSSKGINFPASDLQLRGLTDTDRANLEFIAKHADAVSLSFVRKPQDIIALQDALRQHSTRRIGIITKIETARAFQDLPRMLLATMRYYPAAVMIARGDLAVECGWERLAEMQEEILWMCEAAQMPVIWATQVLEQKTQKGLPSRAEITDAAMSQRADCVMLNKGPHILAAIKMLDGILRRMQAHQHKKTPKLRKLSITEV